MDRRILIGYDPEHHAEDVLKLGRVLAEVLAARPLVVTAVPWPNQLEAAASREEQATAALAESLETVHRELDDLHASTRVVVSSSPALTLSELAEADAGTRLIVLGSAHQGAVGRTLLGSVGQSLMHGAPCAVAIAPRGYAAREHHNLQRIAIAYDGSDEARTALETAIAIAVRCHATITLIAVADYPHYGYGTTWTVLTTGELTDADRREKQRLLEAASEHVPAGVDHDVRLLTGNAGGRLVEASQEFDLMVVGSRGYGPVKSTVLGSTSRRLLSSAACPVLALPRAAGPDPLGFEPGGRASALADTPSLG